MPTPQQVGLRVFGLAGRLVRDLVQEFEPVGWHELLFDEAGLASCVCLAEQFAGRRVETRRMLLLK